MRSVSETGNGTNRSYPIVVWSLQEDKPGSISYFSQSTVWKVSGAQPPFIWECPDPAPPFLKLQSPLNPPPTPFEVAQRNITQCCYHHRNFESDIPGLACDRTLIPNLVHRRDNKCKAQNRCSKSSCSQWEPRWHVPVFKVVEREVAPAEIQVFDADRR